MKIDAKYKPELCVCADITREHITHVHLDVEKKRMAATNGHMCVVVPMEPQEGDATGVVSVEAIKAARKVAGKNDVEFKANGEIKLTNGATLPRPVGIQFPPIDHVIPTYKQGTEGTLTIGVDAKYLLMLAEALGADKKRAIVHITIQLPKPGEAVLDPYVVTVGNDTEKAFGVLMPTRL